VSPIHNKHVNIHRVFECFLRMPITSIIHKEDIRGRIVKGSTTIAQTIRISEDLNRKTEIPVIIKVKVIQSEVKFKDINNDKDEEKVVEAPKPLALIPKQYPIFLQRLIKKANDAKFK
ncbi:hypothetical protein HAX54_016761, partial [Datura stramonium]|nr:hypothetical protein [Datura stramonium]